MSIHYLLNLPYECSDEDLKKAYKTELYKLHPDKSKKDTINSYLVLRKAYEEYITNKSDENFFLLCPLNKINVTVCRCGTSYDQRNIKYDRVECETCSCYIRVTTNLHSLT
ncbi:hypothetical protein AAJ76_3300019743 [Vairimorpha ceranae]|uniref:J domain-containing protein n=1 Tax=Vairimorpha ceranae TaxID=40302 RepID=A0A0F9YR78_9MICR|nr:hypothetical protein AAJ76_3300019743 [Vairimorpha ceranae]KAF5139582.1 hypothetical protein G9O61_00g022570 [Vairimorpha ceranae]KAF5140252.1 hypothetical protein G9O61_00g016390 [Vairimorpha ceranae]KKO75077.1 hypothetical protein AAJ76_3300019743 [Vairimorpha ceranae]